MVPLSIFLTILGDKDDRVIQEQRYRETLLHGKTMYHHSHVFILCVFISSDLCQMQEATEMYKRFHNTKISQGARNTYPFYKTIIY